MPYDLHPETQQALDRIREHCPDTGQLVFVSGTFNTLHPGHLRLLKFAADSGRCLVVGVDTNDHPSAVVDEQLRLDSVAAISLVDHSFIMRDPVGRVIDALRPAKVIKGKEHEKRHNVEASILEAYGGRLLFSSGDIRFSSLDLLGEEMRHFNPSTIAMPTDFCQRHGIEVDGCLANIQAFENKRVLVIGDLIVDQYTACEALGMSQEDPTIVVSPIADEYFLGGAGIVAAHAAGLGAQVDFFSITGADDTAGFARERLAEFAVNAILLEDETRPTTLKQRYRSANKTLLRVNRLRQESIDETKQQALIDNLGDTVRQADAVIFSDFNYGCLPQAVVDEICRQAHEHGVMMLADSQSSSQVGDVSRFEGMSVLTPTEREARLAVHNFEDGLVILAEQLRQKAKAGNVLLTLGSEGMLVQAAAESGPGFVTDRLPALNSAPRDVAGAGDSMLATVALSLVAGADIWTASFLGAIASACQVGRVGNLPLSVEDLLTELRQG